MLRRAALLLSCFFIFIVALFFAYLRAPLHLKAPFDFHVLPGATPTQVMHDLQLRGVLPDSFLMIIFFEVKGKALQAGYYHLTPKMTPHDIFKMFTEGKVIKDTFTIIAGWTFTELRNALAQDVDVVHDLAGVDDATVMQKIAGHAQDPEGEFFPDTYQFHRGELESVILKRAYQKMQHILQSVWQQREPDLPYKNSNELLILASMIEAEINREAERPLAASVFVNRLRHHMRLQADSTVTFTALTKGHYNTYRYTGLPAGPIALPGLPALQAAAHPAHSDYFYFVTKGGHTIFSKTYSEHLRAVHEPIHHV